MRSAAAIVALAAFTVSAEPLHQTAPASTPRFEVKASTAKPQAQESGIWRNIGNTFLMLARTFLPIPKDVIVSGQAFTPSFHAQIDFGAPVNGVSTTGSNGKR